MSVVVRDGARGLAVRTRGRRHLAQRRVRSRRPFAALALLIVAGCSPPQPHRLASAIVDGAVDTGDAAVVALIARRARCEEADPALLCTGTLIAPRVVLTAAHCLDVFGPEGQYEVLFGASLQDAAARFVVVIGAELHPEYDAATHENDLALLRLAQPAPVTPVALPARALTSADVGLPARAVGFGVTHDAAAPAGIKRTGTLRVSAVTDRAFRATGDPSMTCTGDSGGPVFLGVDGGEQLVGVTASGDPGCAEEAFNVRVDAAADPFLRPFVDATALTAVVGPPGARDVDALCGGRCTRSSDCPAGLGCEKDEDGAGRCLASALREGDYGAACETDAQCGGGGQCARLWPDGAAACRCFTPCQPAPAFGCAAAPGSGLGVALVALALALRPFRRR